MSWKKEVGMWVENLTHEMNGLIAYSSRLTTPKSSPSKSSVKVQKAIEFFKAGIMNLIDKCNSLVKFHTDPGNKLEQLRSEYNKALKGLSKLLSISKKPSSQSNYNLSTFASRKRSVSRKQRSSSPSPIKSNRVTSGTPARHVRFSDLENEHADLKSEIDRVLIDIKAHQHTNYEKKIELLEEENLKLHKRISQAIEVSKDNFEFIRELRSRIETLEKQGRSTPSSSSKKQRYLLQSPSSSQI